MESGLLSAFLDDHYDGNYSSFDAENYWNHGNDTLGLQLSEALEGILPLSPVDNKPIFDDDADDQYSYQLDNANMESNTCIIGNWKQDRHFLENEYRPNMSSPSIEIIAVDPNCDYSSPLSNFDDDSEVEYEEDVRKTQCCSRTSKRTMSSSIADYESHTSDESDYENEEVATERNEISTLTDQNIDIPFKLEEDAFKNIPLILDSVESNHITQEGRKSDGISTFETEIINMKNFDLATFITRDDYELSQSCSKVNKIEGVLQKQIAADGDSEGDIIVDIETVPENDNEIIFDKKATGLNNNGYNCSLINSVEDDPIKDPSWSPTTKNTTKGQKSRTRSTNKNPTLGHNKTSTVNKLKASIGNKLIISTGRPSCINQNRKNVGLGRGKNISMCSKPDLSSSSESEEESQDDESNHIKQKNSDHSTNKKIQHTVSNSKVIVQSEKDRNQQRNLPQKISTSIRSPKKAIEVQIKGNQLVEVQPTEKMKQKNCKSIQSLAKVELPKPNEKNLENGQTNNNLKNSIISVDNNCVNDEIKSESIIPRQKKKLNLEEYKKRREKNISLGNSSSDIKSAGIACQSKINSIKLEEPKKADDVPITPSQPNVSKSMLKNEVSQVKIEKQFYDPIIEAKNKVLRLQELKRAAQTKLIDSTVSAKVGPVTKILPLEEIVKSYNTQKSNNKTSSNLNSDYEEIIIVSAGCNTDISLPPQGIIEELIKNNSGNTLLKSNALLYNINNTIQKVKSSENIKISSNSLLSSIQDVVLKKSTPTVLTTNAQSGPNSPDIAVSTPGQLSPVKPEMSHTEVCNGTDSNQRISVPEHGEDKIIMHLRKDRTRAKTQTNSTQTDILPQFPALELIMPVAPLRTKGKSKVNKEKRSRRQYRVRRASSYSSDESDYRSRSRSRIHSISSQSSHCSDTSKHCSGKYLRKQRRHHSKSRSRKHSYRSRSRSRSKGERKGCKTFSSSSCSECSCSRSSSCSSRSRSNSRSSRSRSRSKSKSYFTKNSRPDKRRYDRQVSPAVEERRIVYVGRIEQETTKEDLKRKFMTYGPIRQVTIHYKDTGMKYGFVTFEKAQDAFKAIDNGTRDQKISMYDISFGGRRAFCQASYSDLDGAVTSSLQVCTYPSAIKKPHVEESFEDLLKAVKEKMRGAKSGGSSRVKT